MINSNGELTESVFIFKYRLKLVRGNNCLTAAPADPTTIDLGN